MKNFARQREREGIEAKVALKRLMIFNRVNRYGCVNRVNLFTFKQEEKQYVLQSKIKRYAAKDARATGRLYSWGEFSTDP